MPTKGSEGGVCGHSDGDGDGDSQRRFDGETFLFDTSKLFRLGGILALCWHFGRPLASRQRSQIFRHGSTFQNKVGYKHILPREPDNYKRGEVYIISG